MLHNHIFHNQNNIYFGAAGFGIRKEKQLVAQGHRVVRAVTTKTMDGWCECPFAYYWSCSYMYLSNSTQKTC